ncbi:MAG: universal stress protein [Deltaproteobacteria bacterium]|nr:universal stress protein [Deltaproteobacteria bacterium]
MTEASMPALRTGLELATRLGAEVVVLHVAEQPFGERRWRMPFEQSEEEFLRGLGLRHMEAAHRAVELQVERAAPRPELDVRTVVRTGVPAEAIPASATEERADLIVMGTHGRTGMQHALLGSIAERVVRRAPCPVLTVRPGEP